MRKLQMSEKDILASWREAKDPEKQIAVLAELNAVTPGEIREVLQGLGAELPKKRRGRPKKTDPSPDGQQTAPLASKPSPDGRQAAKETAKETRPAMSAAALGEVLRRVAEAYPETELRLRRGCRVPAAATLTVQWDETGETARTVLEIGG